MSTWGGNDEGTWWSEYGTPSLIYIILSLICTDLGVCTMVVTVVSPTWNLVLLIKSLMDIFWRYNVVQSEWHLLLRTRKKQRNPHLLAAYVRWKQDSILHITILERHQIPKPTGCKIKNKNSPVCSIHNLEQEMRFLSWVLQGTDACVRPSFRFCSILVIISYHVPRMLWSPFN